jgi:hypothetical protein
MSGRPVGFYDGPEFKHAPIVLPRCVGCGAPISDEAAQDEVCLECAAMADYMPRDEGPIDGLPDIRHEDFEDFVIGGTD